VRQLGRGTADNFFGLIPEICRAYWRWLRLHARITCRTRYPILRVEGGGEKEDGISRVKRGGLGRANDLKICGRSVGRKLRLVRCEVSVSRASAN